MDDPGWDFAEHVIHSATLSDTTTFDFQTYYVHRISHCKRQLYLSKLGLSDITDLHGRFKAGRILSQHLKDELDKQNLSLNVDAKLAFTARNIRFVGRCTAHDPRTNRVYHLILRNGWYRFHPPIQRHIDQLQVYLKGLDADRGQLCYVNFGNLADIRMWPPPDADSRYIKFDEDRFNAIVARAEAVSEEIITNGVACSKAEITFAKCDCYFCESEQINFPKISKTTSPAQSPPQQQPAPADSDTESGPPPAAPPLDLPPKDRANATVDDYHVPRDLRERQIWVVWDGREKIALAPWQERHMYPARWSAASGQNPRRSYSKSKMVAELPIREVHQSWPFPDDDLPNEIIPALLLEHEPDDPITVLDFDDVRDPETGETTAEVKTLLAELGGYTEVSCSGTGLHTFIAGSIPGTRRAISFRLRDQGRLECYDHARFVATTWQHVEGTPLDKVPDATDTLESILATYPATH